jgi:hypothetical protein
MTEQGIFGRGSTVAPDRKEPLPLDEMAAVSRDLNVIYINIRGLPPAATDIALA